MNQTYNEQLSFIHSCVNGLCEVKKVQVKHLDNDGEQKGLIVLKKNNDSVIKHVNDIDYASLLEMLGTSGKTLENTLQDMIDGEEHIPLLEGEIIERRKKPKKQQKKNSTVRRILNKRGKTRRNNKSII